MNSLIGHAIALTVIGVAYYVVNKQYMNKLEEILEKAKEAKKDESC